MGFIELFLIAVGLSMDAFAVAICRGLCMEKVTLKRAFIVGLYFGVFQAGMPLIGYALAKNFSKMIEAYDHWIAFILLSVIGINMIRESFKKDDENTYEYCSRDDDHLKFSKMFVLAIATSIDALAVGVTFAFLNVNIYSGVALIGVTTLIISMIGAKIGNIFGVKLKSKAEIFGGVILILIGLKILLEHTGLISL